MKVRKNNFIFLLFFVPILGFSQVKVACVGNSITYGYGIAGRDSLAYPPQLGTILGSSWEVKNFGHSGATMLKNGNLPYWELPEYQQAINYNPDVVIIMLGTNDSKSNNWDNYKDEFKTDYSEMIRKFQSISSKPVIYLGLLIPVVEDTWTIQKKVAEIEISAIIKELSEEFHIVLIDFYHTLENKEDLIPDKIHPNAEGAALMAQAAAEVLLKGKNR